jgi:hypothetical protein
VKRLLAVGGFAHDSQGVLAAVYWLALVGSECLHYFRVRLLPRPFVGLELAIASLTDADSRRRFLNDPQTAFWHVQSLAHREGPRPVEIKRHHYLDFVHLWAQARKRILETIFSCIAD